MNHHMYFALYLQTPNKFRKQNQACQLLAMGRKCSYHLFSQRSFLQLELYQGLKDSNKLQMLIQHITALHVLFASRINSEIHSFHVVSKYVPSTKYLGTVIPFQHQNSQLTGWCQF